MSELVRANYHTHTPRCHHAGGTEEEYVLTAIENGFSVLGFSDHTPWSFEDGYVSPVRMLPEELPDYVHTVRELKSKYADRIRILCGLECECYTSKFSWLKEQKERFSLDYLIIGNHFAEPESAGVFLGKNIDTIRYYVRTAIAGMESGLFAYIAHPDVAIQALTAWDDAVEDAMRELCRAAKAFNIPLEYNLLGKIYARRPENEGRLCYPTPHFWELAAKEGCTAIVGVDAHQVAHMTQVAEYDAAYAYLYSLGMDCIHTLPLGG